ncbi:hypothetical protein SAMN05421819_3475 [Bryocella elongata]|uniref:VWFA-related domain-containing protein n=1 Tax=Bryocella elongata TaxID=863522 RepID=A0A1H6B450_9BACT|nr:hypothetical protein [Bryocella elongata]SEG55165.1 hypothetical protein SAMN05421819_3475 [Bryocella elongata]
MLWVRHFALAVLLLCAGHADAQQATPSGGTEGQPYTLHVYANRMQSATLILNGRSENIHGVTPDKVTVSLDSGPRFHPTAVRPEGDDPLQIAALLDAGDSDRLFLEAVVAALPNLAGSALRPTDKISLYAMDCTLISSLNQTAASADAMRIGLQKVLNAPTLHGPGGHHCGSSVHLWDRIGRVLCRMAETPGRRVPLVVSPGLDSGSSTALSKLSLYAAMLSVAIFNLRHDDITGSGIRQPVVVGPVTSLQNREDAMSILTSSSGGLIFSTLSWLAPSTLEEFVHLLRTRYIVEFPAPDRSKEGLHDLQIRVPKAYAVLPVGVSWNDLDSAVKNDPSTVQAPPSPAVLGTRRPLIPK